MSEPSSSDPNDNPGLPPESGGDASEQRQMSPEAQWSHYTRYLFLLAKLLFFGLIAAAGLWMLDSLSSVLFPLFISLLIAYLLDPGIDWFEARGINRTVGILIFLAAGLTILGGVALFLYPTLARQLGNIVDKAPQLVDLAQNRTLPWVEKTFNYDLPPTLDDAVATYGADIKEAAPGVLQRIGEWVRDAASRTGAIAVSLLNLVMIPVFSFYFLRDFDAMKAKVCELLPAYREEFLLDRLKLVDGVVGEWFRGQLQVAGILAVMYAIGLGVVFGLTGIDVTSGIAIGLITGLLNIIPYFGVLIGVILAGLVVLLEWAGIGSVLGVGAVFVVTQLLEGYWITPRIVGEKVGLSPVTVIIVLLLGGELAGLLGILLAIPIAGAIKVILPDIINYYRETPFYNGEGARPAFAGVMGNFLPTQPEPELDEPEPEPDEPEPEPDEPEPEPDEPEPEPDELEPEPDEPEPEPDEPEPELEPAPSE
ncbi:MAG: AI-2E family transporter [Persicimonas sp.]